MPILDLNPALRGEPAHTLVLFHHAGGSSRGFAPLLPHLPADWRVWGVDLPGRLLDRGTARCRTAAEAVDYLRTTLGPALSGPFSVFGHSLGALLAFEVARRLESERRGPCWLGVSGSRAPQRLGAVPSPSRPARDLLSQVHGLGGWPGDHDDRHALARLVARTLSADLNLVDDYAYTPGTPLRTALSVFGGKDDPLAPAAALGEWSALASGPVPCHTWPGGHFYLYEHAEAVCARLVASCRSQTTRG
ncbi:thioesterase [Streptomyces misionensis]|uniref:Thioesterase n=1 Tax=Streptomyces misionensis TaxID=67331 RepID=A0A5C6J3D0_9ACTN|nr:alpha/beta fold hydrolase [Streptomyces misionensis]TWV34947.1 thioesterase [Streptomyces misionensis]